VNTSPTASGLTTRTRRRAALIAALTLPLSLLSAPAIAQGPTPPPATTPTPTTPPSAPATPTAKALAQAKKDNRRVEIESLRSESATFHANPDGKTIRMELSTQPIRVKNADGKGFTPIETTLVEAAGAIKPKAAPGDLVLSAGGDKTLIKSRAADATAKINTPSTLPEPRLRGNTATYPGAYGKGRDLVVIASATGFRQQVTIAERPTDPVSIRVAMDLPEGLSFKKNAAGRPTIVGKDGKTITEIRPTLLQDAKAADAGAPLDAGKVGRAAVTLAEDGKTLVFTPDAAFLADPATTYPVTMTAAADDWYEGHTGQWSLGGMDTWINDYDYQDSWDTFTQTQIVVGKSYASSIAKRWRGYLKFPDIPAEFAGSRVENADLHLWNYQSNDCGISVGSGITARQITSDWDETTLLWGSQPSVTSAGADTEFGAYSEDCTGSMNYAWDLTHALNGIVQAWVDGATNYGIQLTAGDESELRNWRRYTSEDAGGCRTSPLEACKGQLHPPILTVDFEPRTVEVVFYSYEGPKRHNVTYEEALALRAASELSVPDLPGVSVGDADALALSAGTPYEVRADKLDPFPGEDTDPVNYPDPQSLPDGDTPPAVVAQQPAADADNVPVDTDVTVTFDEPVLDAQLTLTGPNGVSLAGQTVMSSDEKVLTFSPAEALPPGASIIATLTGTKNVYGNPLPPYTWSFTTKGGPAGQWKLDEGVGDKAADSSGQGNDAILNETAVWTPGKSGTALSNTPLQPRAIASQEAARTRAVTEVTNETSESSITYALPDGSFRTEIAGGPVRTRQADKWVPIDTTLAEQGGKLRPKALAEGAIVEISAGGTDPFVKVSADGKSYALRWPTPLPKPTVKGSVATYTDAAGTGADLVMTVLPTGFRHEVVLRQRPTKPLELRIGVEDDGLTLTEGNGGRLLLQGKNKKTIVSAPRPVMWDGSAKGRRPLAKRAKVATEVTTKEGRTELVVKPDQQFLADSATTYPVRIQPLAASTSSDDVALFSTDTADSPATPDSPIMIAGVQQTQKVRAYLRFPTGSLQGQTVTDAKVSLYNFESSACGASVGDGLQVRRVTGAWDANNLYWANKPAATTEDAQINKAGYDLACSGGAQRLEWNVTGIAQDWAAGAADHGLVVQSPSEGSTTNWRYLTASEDTDFNEPPILTLTTSGPVSAPTVSSPAITPAHTVDGSTVTSSLTPQLAATVVDTAGGNLTGEFEVEHDPAATGQGSGQIWAGASQAVASGGQATVNVPAGKLTDGWKIRWRARAANPSASTTSAWSDWQTATVDVPNPTVDAFQVTPSQVLDGGTVATSLTPALRATVTDPAGQPLRAEFELEHDPAATTQGTGQIWTGAADNVASGTQATAAIPDGKLADGWKVRWRIRAVNTATTVGSPWSDWQTLNVDVPDPVSEPAVGTLQVSPSEQVDGTTVTPILTPALLAQVHDPAGGALRAEAEIEHDPAAAEQGSGQIWTGGADNVPAGTQAGIAVPAGTLADGWKVRWRARAVSATAASAWSDWQSFTVSLPKPSATGLTITPSKVVDGVTVTDTLTPSLKATLTHPTGQALRAEAEIEHDPAAPDGQGSGQIWAGAVNNVASGTQASLTVPADKLADGWKVRWRLRAVAGDVSSGWSDWQQITVDVTQPGEEPLAQTAEPVIRTDQSFTAAAWLRWSDANGNYTVLEQNGTHQAPFRLGNTPDHGLVFTLTSADAADATVAGVLSGVEPPVDEWFHLAGVYDATSKTASLYLNGALIKAETINIAAWNSTGVTTLGSRMRGALDDVAVYQRALAPAEIASLMANPAVAPIASPQTSQSESVSVMADRPFNYDYYTLSTCRDLSPDNNTKQGVWGHLRAYSGCIVRWNEVGVFVTDSKGNKVRFEKDDFAFRSTVVINTYLGKGELEDRVQNPGADGTSARNPRDISMWVSITDLEYDWDDPAFAAIQMRLEVSPKTGKSGGSCGTKQTVSKKASQWTSSPASLSFRSVGGEVNTCTLRPWIVLENTDWFHWGDQSVPLWDRPEDLSSEEIAAGKDNAPKIRCDSLTFGAGGRLPNIPLEDSPRMRGACILYQADRIYTMETRDVERGAVAKHIHKAFTQPDQTVPANPDGSAKSFVGNYDAAGGSRKENALKRANPATPGWDGRPWFQSNRLLQPRICAREITVGEGQQCDEYPFNSTYQTAASQGLTPKNYSVQAVAQTHNSKAGRDLGLFYARYRVGRDNTFWVRIVDNDGTS
jgi:hypothetical protein